MTREIPAPCPHCGQATLIKPDGWTAGGPVECTNPACDSNYPDGPLNLPDQIHGTLQLVSGDLVGVTANRTTEIDGSGCTVYQITVPFFLNYLGDVVLAENLAIDVLPGMSTLVMTLDPDAEPFIL